MKMVRRSDDSIRSNSVRGVEDETETQQESSTPIHQDSQSQATNASSAAVRRVGRLAVLQPLDGSLTGAEVSQLMAHLVLAPTASTTPSKLQHNSATEGASPSRLQTAATDPESYLLAPNASSDGIKLQMIEIQPPHTNVIDGSRKYVEFQVTLSSDASNKPHLYCAMAGPSSGLQMERCDQDVALKASTEGNRPSSRVFLYDSLTGEVVPSRMDAIPSAQSEEEREASRQAVAQAIAQLAEGDAQKTSTEAAKRQLKAAGQSPDTDRRRPVKLVFLADEAEQPEGQGPEELARPSMTDDDKPPLLRPYIESPSERRRWSIRTDRNL